MLSILITLSVSAMVDRVTGAYSDCYLTIDSAGNEKMRPSQLDQINETAQICRSEAVALVYRRKNRFQTDGESLSELSEYIQLLTESISSFESVKIEISNAKGLSVDFKVPNFGNDSSLRIEFMLFDLRIVNRDGSPQENCSSDYPVFRPWSNTKSTMMDIHKAIRYHERTCATIFRNSRLSQLAISELTESTVKHNMLTFEPNNESLNATIEYLVLSGYGVNFNTKIFPTTLFGQTRRVEISGLVKSFETSAMRNSSLILIKLISFRLRRFFHNNPNWLNNARFRAVQDTLVILIDSRDTFQMSSGLNAFINEVELFEAQPFDDSSFCVFYQIKVYSLNIKLDGHLIERQAHENCTCLLFWLISNYWAHDDFYALYYSDLGLCVQNRANLSEQCQFEKMAQRCSIETVQPFGYLTKIDHVFGLEFAKYLADVWLTPAMCVFGFVANFLVISTFRKIKRSPEYRRNKLTDKARFMWDYTYYNSWFVLFHALTFSFSPLSTCIEYNGIYCPELALTKLSQTYFLFVESFFGNTMRLMANLSQSLFVLFRFGLNTDRVNRFRKIRPRKLLAYLSLPSALVSVVTLFINDRFSIDLLFQESENYILYLFFDNMNGGVGLQIAYLFNVFVGTTLFTLFNMLVDLRLLGLLRKQNAQRPKEEVEKRITKMVILNGLFSFLFRMPEMVSTFVLIIHAFHPDFLASCIVVGSRYNSVCPMLFDISRFLLTVSFLENLLLLYLFNPNFKKHFSNQKIQGTK
nr:G protein-coupled receptor [Proales similis]